MDSLTNRLKIVDILRGFALTGVLFANFTGFIDQQVPTDVLLKISSSLDTLLLSLNAIFIEFKFITLFSILFGFSFGLIMEKVNAEPDSYWIYARRMLGLFLIGTVHTFYWWFDILHIYAVAGIFLLLYRKASNKALLINSLVLMLVIPALFSFFNRNASDALSDNDYRLIYEQFKNGDLMALFRTNILGYYRLFIESGSDLYYITETLGRFLLGYFLFRLKVLDSLSLKKAAIKRVSYLTFPITIGYFVLRAMAISKALNIDVFYLEPVIKFGILNTTTFYCSGIILLYLRFPSNFVFAGFAVLGKMTLTNYLLISTIMIFILYGIGLGQLGEIKIQTIWLIGIAWWTFEVFASRYWLSKFRFGPVEWIWRRFSYWKSIPLKR